jgi:sugar phosphate isomerase/epimerase
VTVTIACMTNGYAGCPLERVLAGIAGAGFRHVELTAGPSAHARYRPDAMGRAEIAAALAQLRAFGLAPVSVAAHADLATPAGVAALKAGIDFAAAVGASIVTTGTGHTGTPEAVERFFALIGEVAAHAAERRVTVALESHGGLTGTGPDTRRTIERIGSPWVRVNYDPANVIYYRGVRPEADLPTIAEYVRHFHAKDSAGEPGELDFPTPGQGTIDFAQLFGVLRETGFVGPYSVELEASGLSLPQEDEAREQAFSFLSRTLGSDASVSGREGRQGSERSHHRFAGTPDRGPVRRSDQRQGRER